MVGAGRRTPASAGPSHWSTVETADVATQLRSDAATATAGRRHRRLADRGDGPARRVDRRIGVAPTSTTCSTRWARSALAAGPRQPRGRADRGARRRSRGAGSPTSWARSTSGWPRVCDRVVLVVAGQPVTVKDAGRVTDFRGSSRRPTPDVAAAARARQDRLTKPPGSLGRLEDLSVWVASCQGACPPRQFAAAAGGGVRRRPRRRPRPGCRPIRRRSPRRWSPTSTRAAPRSTCSPRRRARPCGWSTSRSMPTEPLSPSIGAHKVRRGSGNIAVEDALTADEVAAAIDAGRRIADEEVDSGADLLIAGDMGIGNTTPATTLIAALTDSEPVAVVGRGTGIDDAGWARKTAAIRDALYRARGASGGSRCAAAGLRWGRPGGDGGVLRAGRGAPHAGAARRRGGDGGGVGGRTTRARCPAVVAGGSPVHRTGACAGAAAPGARTDRRHADAARRGHRRRGRAAHRAGRGGHAGVDGHVRRSRNHRRSATDA